MIGKNTFTLCIPIFIIVQVKVASLPAGNVTFPKCPRNSGPDDSIPCTFKSERKQIMSY